MSVRQFAKHRGVTGGDIHTTCVYDVDGKIIEHHTMAKRINVILPEVTVRTIDRLTRPGQRSRFIERAVRHYVTTASPEALQERLKQAAIRDQDLDLEIASDWFAVDREQWQKLQKKEDRRVQAGPKEAKSTSRRSTPQ